VLRGATDVRVLVVGDLMLDRYVSGRVERISPEAPVPVVRVESERVALGGAANVAANVTALGAACALVGCIGDDPEGELLLAQLAAHDVDATGVASVSGRPTTVKTRVHAKPQQIVRFDREVDDEIDGDVAEALSASIRSLTPGCDVIVIQDYDKGVLANGVVEAVLGAAVAAGVSVVVDPKRRAFFRYEGATVFKPNLRELEDALGARARPDDDAWMEEIRLRLGCHHLLLTLGDRGMALKGAETPVVLLPSRPTEVYDVSGAGDTVSATVAVALAAGATPVEAAALANHAAAVEVQRPGVRTVEPAEVIAHVEAWPG